MQPSVGRIVHLKTRNLGFERGVDGSIIYEAAIITQVHSETLVNLTVFRRDGRTEPKTSVPFNQDLGVENTWCWPPRV